MMEEVYSDSMKPKDERITNLTELVFSWSFEDILDEKLYADQADFDGDGALNYGEFVVVSVHLRKMANDEHLHKAFSFFDKNKSGYIEIDELRHALSDEDDANSEDVINAIMHDVDTDKDGRISFEEFAAKMKAGTDWRKASRQYSRERYNSISLKLMQDGSFQVPTVEPRKDQVLAIHVELPESSSHNIFNY